MRSFYMLPGPQIETCMDPELDLFINQNLNWILDLDPFMNGNLNRFQTWFFHRSEALDN